MLNFRSLMPGSISFEDASCQRKTPSEYMDEIERLRKIVGRTNQYGPEAKSSILKGIHSNMSCEELLMLAVDGIGRLTDDGSFKDIVEKMMERL